MVVHNGGQNIRGLTLPARLKQLLIHPYFVQVITRVGVFTILPVGSPAHISSVHDVHESLAFARVVSVVIRRNQVSVFVKHKLVGVAKPGGKYLKIASVWIGPHDHTLVRMAVIDALFSRDIGAYIAYAPIDPAIRPLYSTRHPMPAKPDMDAIAVADRFFLIQNPVAIGIGKAPHIRCYSHEYILRPYQ